MRLSICASLGLMMSLLVAACQTTTGDNSVPVSDDVKADVYARFVSKFPYYRTLDGDRVAVACINWAFTDLPYVDYRRVFIDHTSASSDAAISIETLQSGAIFRCNQARRRGGRDCQCVPIVFNDKVILKTPPKDSPLRLRQHARKAFQAYLSDDDFAHYKAFAYAKENGSYGRCWLYWTAARATECAMDYCSRRSANCELYALGNQVVYGLPAASLAEATNSYSKAYAQLGEEFRVHGRLLRLSRSHKQTDRSAVIVPPPSNLDIAKWSRTSEEAVARVLGDLERDRVIERRADAMIVNDIDRLIELVKSGTMVPGLY